MNRSRNENVSFFENLESRTLMSGDTLPADAPPTPPADPQTNAVVMLVGADLQGDGQATAGKTFRIFVTGPGGLSRNLSEAAAGGWMPIVGDWNGDGHDGHIEIESFSWGALNRALELFDFPGEYTQRFDVIDKGSDADAADQTGFEYTNDFACIPTALPAIQDGASNTIFFGERYSAASAVPTSGSFSLYLLPYIEQGNVTGGVNVLLGDGSVRFIKDSISLNYAKIEQRYTPVSDNAHQTVTIGAAQSLTVGAAQTLEGQQCLVFFLGGVQEPATDWLVHLDRQTSTPKYWVFGTELPQSGDTAGQTVQNRQSDLGFVVRLVEVDTGDSGASFATEPARQVTIVQDL